MSNSFIEFSHAAKTILDKNDEPSTKIVSLAELFSGKNIDELACSDSLDEQSEQLRFDLLTLICGWLLSLDDVPDELISDYCNIGDMCSIALQDGASWVSFKKIKLQYLVENNSIEDAKVIFNQLVDLIPNDDFLELIRKRLHSSLNPEQRLAHKLNRETNWKTFCKLAKVASQRHTLICVTAGVALWNSAEMAKGLSEIGFITNLTSKRGSSFIGIISRGRLVYEATSDISKIVYAGVIEKSTLEAISSGHFKNHPEYSKIVINGHVLKPSSSSGTFFVILDEQTGKIIAKSFFFTSKDPILHEGTDHPLIAKWREAHPEIGFIGFREVAFPTNEAEWTDNERFIMKHNLSYSHIFDIAQKKQFNFATPMLEYVNDWDGVIEVLSSPPAYIGTHGARRMHDVTGRYVNIVNGHRITLDQPSEYEKTVWLLGGCGTFGIGVSDDGTMATFLQRLLNEFAPEERIIVQNYAYPLDGVADSYREIVNILESLPIEPGDIVAGVTNNGLIADASVYGERPHDYGELFYDWHHKTQNGLKLSAQAAFDKLIEVDFFSALNSRKPLKTNKKSEISDYGLTPEQLSELKQYKEKIRSILPKNLPQDARIGCIVMNCNPFTLGHQYLIEQASQAVDYLIIFVVREDKSIFPFADRFFLVNKGIEHLNNVFVVESGKFIISSITFEAYFNKSSFQDRIIDSSTDVTLFAREIAPAAGISIRFAGSEPNDKVTAQYNLEMAAILPKYGIEFCELPRIEQDNAPISASKVRELLEKKDFSSIERLVPQTTLEYLKEKGKSFT